MDAVENSPVGRHGSWVSCPNPFYLLSAACILHSSCWSLPGRDTGFPSLVVMGLVAGYTLVLAIITLIVVRRWQVWDDARSMLVMLLLLCVDLALLADEWVIVKPEQGWWLLAGGFLFSVGLTELIHRNLRLGLSWVWLGPHYLQLGLIYFWPYLVVCVPADHPLRRGLIHLYFVVVGFSFLLLWFAARRGPARMSMPPGWKWPIHPWSWFIVNTFSCLARGYALALSLDPVFNLPNDAAMHQLHSIVDGHFLTPLLLAWGLVVFECGHRSQRSGVKVTGQLLVACGVLLSVPHAPSNGAQAAYIAWLTSLGISPWVMALSCGVGCGLWFDRRGGSLGQWGVLAGMILLAITRGQPNFIALQPESWSTWLIWIAALWWIARPSTWKATGRQLVAIGLLLLAALGEGGMHNPVYSEAGLALRLAELSIAILAVRGVDQFARSLRSPLQVLGVIQVSSLMGWLWITHPAMTPLVIDSWLIGLCSGGVAVRAGDAWSRRVVCVTGAIVYMLHLSIGFQTIESQFRWAGWPAFAMGVLLLHFGLAFSLWKGQSAVGRAPLARP